MAFGVKVFILPKVRSFSFVVIELSLLYHFYVSATFRKVLALKSMYVRNVVRNRVTIGLSIPEKAYNSPC